MSSLNTSSHTTGLTPTAPQFGYAGKWFPVLDDVKKAAFLVKSNPAPVGVEFIPGYANLAPNYRVVTENEFHYAGQAGRLVWIA